LNGVDLWHGNSGVVFVLCKWEKKLYTCC